MLKNITFFAFAVVAFLCATCAFSLVNEPAIGQTLSSLIKRDQNLNTGGPDPPDNLLSIGYYTFKDSFIKKLRSINSTDEATQFLNKEITPKAKKYAKTCLKMTNSSAKAAGRTDTTARVIWEATADPKYEIDPVYGFDLPLKTACWERALNGDINKPVFDYSQQLLKEFHWDKAYAEAYLQEQHKRFKPATST